MDGYQQRSDEKKQRIVRAAVELFQQYGAEKVTIRDIANQAGVSHVTVYKYFGNHIEIVHHIIKTQALMILGKLREVKSSAIPLEEKLNYLVFQREELVGQSRKNQLLRIIYGDPDLKEFFVSVWQKEISKIEMELLEEGIRCGCISTSVSKDTLRMYLDIVREGLLADSSRLQFDNLTMRDLHFLVLNGILKK